MSCFGIHNNLTDLLSYLDRHKVDLVFNLCEAFAGSRELAKDLLSVFELSGISYTGARPSTLSLCSNKVISKKILLSTNLLTPKFQLINNLASITDEPQFPVIVKPAYLDGSEGISKSGICQNKSQLRKRVQYLLAKFSSPVLVEEFIEGREINVGYLGKGEILTPTEVVFPKSLNPQKEIASYKVKWDEAFRKKMQIKTVKAKLSQKELHSIREIVCKANEALGIDSYCRFDIRLARGVPYIIEVNVNPGISKHEDFSIAAKLSGYHYQNMIELILTESKRESPINQNVA